MAKWSKYHRVHGGFESARTLAKQPHGHSFEVSAILDASISACRHTAQQSLEATCEQLSYQDLNQWLDNEPDDPAIVQWIQQSLASEALVSVELKSAPHTYTEFKIASSHPWTISRRFFFEAAHQLPNVPVGHKCGRMHGHGFAVTLTVAIDPSEPAALAHKKIHEAWAPLHQSLAWSCLNDIDGLENPTSEHLALWLWQKLSSSLALVSVSVNETPTAGCRFDGEDMAIWKAQTIDSAVRLAGLRDGDPRCAIHGHTFNVELHLTGALDDVQGWVHDFGDVKLAFAPLFKALDHHPLYDIPGLEHADDITLAGYIAQHMQPLLPKLTGVTVEHQKGQGAHVEKGD